MLLPFDAGDGLRYLIDENGEVVVETVDETFAVDSAEKVDWVLSKLAALDADVEAVDNSAMVRQARAILENAGKLKADIERRRASLRWRFGPELEAFAKANAPKGKKSWQSLVGFVKWAKVSAAVRVESPEAAIKWATEKHSEALRFTFDLNGIEDADTRAALVELAAETGADTEFKISWLPKSVAAEILADAKLAEGTGLRVDPEGERVEIGTGVSK